MLSFSSDKQSEYPLQSIPYGLSDLATERRGTRENALLIFGNDNMASLL